MTDGNDTNPMSLLNTTVRLDLYGVKHVWLRNTVRDWSHTTSRVRVSLPFWSRFTDPQLELKKITRVIVDGFKHE